MLLVKKRVGIFVFKTVNNYGLFIQFIMRINKNANVKYMISYMII